MNVILAMHKDHKDYYNVEAKSSEILEKISIKTLLKILITITLCIDISCADLKQEEKRSKTYLSQFVFH